MFFTQEDYKKIQHWLALHSKKDTEFNEAVAPLNGEETIAFVQNGYNVKASLKDFLEQLIILLDVPDFLNVTEKYNERNISLNEATQLIPSKDRKTGQVITFLDEEGKWQIYQFRGERVNQWNTISLWIDLIQKFAGTNTGADEEDLTSIIKNDKSVLKFKDRPYNEDDFSGLGRVYLRKNITEVIDSTTKKNTRINLLTQLMLGKDNTIYLIQYDYNLNGQTLTVPENSILDFKSGGNFTNGTINCTNTTIRIDNFDLLGAVLTGTYTVVGATNEDKSPYINNTEYVPNGYSGMGHIYLRKNRGVLTQDDITKNNTIYHIRYDFNLNGQEITIPDNSILDFKNGGNFSNGIINCVNTIIRIDNFDSLGVTLTGSYKVVSALNDDKSPYMNDTEYNVKEHSGLGHVYLRKNKGILTQDRLTKSNTIYHIRYDYDLQGEEITIPENCILKFEGGSLNNGTINFSDSIIESIIKYGILPNCKGSVKNNILYPEWFYNLENDYSRAIQIATNIGTINGCTIEFTKPEYLVKGDSIIMASNITYLSKRSSKIYTRSSNTYKAIFYSGKSPIENVTFDGLTISQENEEFIHFEGTVPYMYCILSYTGINFTVKNCNFISVGTNCIVNNGSICNNSVITNNTFKFVRIKNNNNSIDYDNSLVYINDKNHTIEYNKIINDNTLKNRSRGGIETHGSLGSVSNNIISNCNNAINIVETEDKLELSALRTISNNIIYNCITFCCFWPVSIFNPIRNITISNNNVVDIMHVINVNVSNTETQEIDGVYIYGNYCKGIYTEYTSDSNRMNSMAFRFSNIGSIKNIIIECNTISSFPNGILGSTVWSKKEGCTNNVIFRNNECLDCFNSKMDGVSAIDARNLFFIGMNDNYIITDNYISIKKFDSFTYGTLIYSSDYGNNSVTFINNKFGEIVNHNVILSKETKYHIDFVNYLSKERYNNKNIIANIKDNDLLLLNDKILYNNELYNVTSEGHINSVIENIDISKIVYHTHAGCICYLENVNVNINAGCLLNFKTTGEVQKEVKGITVTNTVNGIVYISLFPSTINVNTANIEFLKYYKASIEKLDDTLP